MKIPMSFKFLMTSEFMIHEDSDVIIMQPHIKDQSDDKFSNDSYFYIYKVWNTLYINIIMHNINSLV